MLNFFRETGMTALAVIALLAPISTLTQNFWRR